MGVYKKKIINDSRLITDFMQSRDGKGGARDPLTRQVTGMRRKLSAKELTNMYADNAMVQNIVDIPAEDITRAGFTLKMKDDKLKGEYESKLRQLKVKDVFKDLYAFDRLYGDGFISIGVVSKEAYELSEPLDMDNLKRIPYINAFSNQKVNNFFVNEDMFSERFGKVEQFEVMRRTNEVGPETLGITEDKQEKVHYSRVIHQQSKRLENEHLGLSLIESLSDILVVMDTSLWSVGQMLYDYCFKVFKSNDVGELSNEEKSTLGMLMDYKFRTEAMAIIESDEELSKEGTNTSGVDQLLSFVWDYLAGAVRMPKTVLKGQESGTITGAQYDVMNYYSRIAAIQENEMRPQLEYLIRCLMMAEDECGGAIDPDEVEWSIEFNPLWNVDAKTDAEIRKLTAETDKIYIEQGVLEPEEVHETRFGRFGLTESSKFNADAADNIDDLSVAVYEAWKKKEKGDANG